LRAVPTPRTQAMMYSRLFLGPPHLMKAAAFSFALALAGAPAIAQTPSGMIVPNEATGNFEIRDNTGRVTGYVRPNDAVGGYEVDDAAGRSGVSHSR
jgi:hypothetical protein